VGDERPSGYADLLAALLAVRSDPATERFDAELARAEAQGLVDAATARTLRWWQRESLRGLADHLGHVLPHLLDDLARAQEEAADAVSDSASSWSQASASSERAAAVAPEPIPGGSHLRPVEDSASRHPSNPAGSLPTGLAPSVASGHQDPQPPSLPSAPRLLRPGFAPPDRDPSSLRPPTSGASRPRLLVSGVTVRHEAQRPTPVVDLTDPRPADPCP
jgi:hypothetical protein